MSTYQTPPADCDCEQPTCYDCRRQAIDATALYIKEREVRYCSGMIGFDVEAHAWAMADQYRCAAINALAFELWPLTEANQPTDQELLTQIFP